ncbi:hypothetical protein MRB53_037453 [Persea americana]|nr:hypothetical protein MRB53_037453 [Persea americana]
MNNQTNVLTQNLVVQPSSRYDDYSQSIIPARYVILLNIYDPVNGNTHLLHEDYYLCLKSVGLVAARSFRSSPVSCCHNCKDRSAATDVNHVMDNAACHS